MDASYADLSHRSWGVSYLYSSSKLSPLALWLCISWMASSSSFQVLSAHHVTSHVSQTLGKPFNRSRNVSRTCILRIRFHAMLQHVPDGLPSASALRPSYVSRPWNHHGAFFPRASLVSSKDGP